MEYNKTTQVIIPISEYDELLDIKKTFVKAFDEKSLIMRYRTWNCGPGGPAKEFTLVNHSDVIETLNEQVRLFHDRNNQLYIELRDLKEKCENKKWYQFIPIKD